MQEVFEKIKEKCQKCSGIGRSSFVEFLKIIDEVAEEYNNGWIPCSKRLPEEAFGCLVVVEDTEPMTGKDFETILPYFVCYDSGSWCDAEGQEIPFEVIAWQPLPEPYQPKGE